MACPNCEELPDALPAPCRIYLWPPLGHTASKLARWQPTAGTIRRVPESERCLIVEVAPDSLGGNMVELSGILTPQELSDVKALAMPLDREPGFADFPRVVPLRQLVAQHQSVWLTSMLRDRRHFSVYQPIFHQDDVATPFAYEALLRGADTDGAIIPAGHMFGTARDAGIAFQLDLQARLSAIEQFRPAQRDTKLFVNFSPVAIYDPAFCLRTTIARIAEAGLSPSQVVFEVIESEEHTNLAHLRGILSHYRRSGFQVALDDFGAGYNGIQVLEQLQPDFVKFDMHLVRGIDSDSTKAMILADLVGLCRKLGAATLAEGIETEEELATVRTIGVDFLQGYLFGRPARLTEQSAA